MHGTGTEKYYHLVTFLLNSKSLKTTLLDDSSSLKTMRRMKISPGDSAYRMMPYGTGFILVYLR
jgi:hypothetical protein